MMSLQVKMTIEAPQLSKSESVSLSAYEAEGTGLL